MRTIAKCSTYRGHSKLKGENFYQEFYGFEHQHEQWLDKAAYGLAEWNEQSAEAQLVAVAGCYPTASQLAIKPLVEAKLLDENQ